VEKALIEASKDSGSFEVRRGHDLLTEVLGTPEHRGRVRGVQSRMSWSAVELWQSDTSSFKSRQRYKDSIYRKGYDEGMSDMIKSSIKDAFMSNDPEMVAMRTHMLCQAGVPVPQTPQGQMVPLLEDRPRRPIEEIEKLTHVQLTVPFGRSKKIVVAEGVVHPHHYAPKVYQGQIPDNYTVMTPTWIHPDHQEYEIDLPDIQQVRILSATECEEILWCKDDIEIMEAMPTPTPTLTSAAGSCPPKGDLGDDDDDDEGEGGDDNGKKGSPRGMSPPPPPRSPPPGSTNNEVGGLGAPPGGKTTPASQPSTSGPPPPPPPPRRSPLGPTNEVGVQGHHRGARRRRQANRARAGHLHLPTLSLRG
jgi:hypothetical protein